MNDLWKLARTTSLLVFVVLLATRPARPQAAQADGAIAKAVLEAAAGEENRLDSKAWRPWGDGFTRRGAEFLCDNGHDASAQRGASQTVQLNQTRPEPIVALASSAAENVSGSSDSNYAVYLDLTYTDGTHLWGQTAPFSPGTHDWQERRVLVLPEKPVRSLAFHLLLRSHAGKARFRGAELRIVRAPEGAALFDGVPVVSSQQPSEGFQIRDVAAGSDFLRIDRHALGLELDVRHAQENGAVFFDVTLRDTSGKDRAVTLLYAVSIDPVGLRWLDDPRSETAVEPMREYMNARTFRAGANGRLSRYPFGAVADADGGVALGIDMARPAFYRVGYNAASGELFLAYDVGLTPEKPEARLRLCRYAFDPTWGFRGALDRYYRIFPEAFQRRVSEQGLWMPFAKISQVEGWQDFGFVFKEGNNETAWDDAHDVVTFRYTEPMTWWMRMPPEIPRTIAAATAEARRLADQGDTRAAALLSAGYHDRQGQLPAQITDAPWCDGAVWSVNSSPGVVGEVTDFKNKWNPSLVETLYGPDRQGDLDGEYIDSSEGYVTDELNFRRDHFGSADTPLTFSMHDHHPAVFRGLIAFEYVRAIAADVHGMDKLMMANSTPIRLCWLAPLLDVMGTETNWNPAGRWSPMSDAELLYRRSLCGQKPFCFLMNTRFEEFSQELVERYMKRSLAYGMFPGFFSHNASQGHYFNRPEFYNRDRPLFKKYVPLCKLVAEAGWRPITLARSDDENVHIERFGDRYVTVFNDSAEPRTVTVTLSDTAPTSARDLVTGQAVSFVDNRTTLALQPEDVAVLDLGDGSP